MKSCITINLKKDNRVIKINEDFSQEDIMYSLRKKKPELKKLYQSESFKRHNSRRSKRAMKKLSKRKKSIGIQNLDKLKD